MCLLPFGPSHGYLLQSAYSGVVPYPQWLWWWCVMYWRVLLADHTESTADTNYCPQLFHSSLTNPAFPNRTTVDIRTKPSSIIPFHFYTFNKLATSIVHELSVLNIASVMERAAPSSCFKTPQSGPIAGSVIQQETATLVGPMTLKESWQIWNNRIKILLPYQEYTVTQRQSNSC